MTSEKWFVLPLLLHFMQVFVIGVMMGRARFKAVATGRAKRDEIEINDMAWPRDVLQISKNFNNQFQVPSIWYALSILVVVLKLVDPILIVLSWMFLASRLVHSAIHLTTNKLPDRFYAYLLGFFILAFMWLWFALKYFGHRF